DVDLVARSAGAEVGVAAQLADFIDAPVAGAVDLEHVDVFAGRNATAHVAVIARGRGRAAFAVERFGQDASRRGFAAAGCAGEKVGVRRPVAFEGVDQGASHGLLADEGVKLLRPVAASEDRVLSGTSGRRRLLDRLWFAFGHWC